MNKRSLKKHVKSLKKIVDGTSFSSTDYKNYPDIEVYHMKRDSIYETFIKDIKNMEDIEEIKYIAKTITDKLIKNKFNNHLWYA